jgi:predicted GNAT family acetyltransferase
MEPEGYTKEVDLVNYNIPMPKQLPPLYTKVFEKVLRSGDYEIIEFGSKKDIRPYIIPVLELMNYTFNDIYGFVPLNDKEKEEFASRYLPIVHPEFIKVVRSGKELVGFVIALPDMTPGIIAAKGRLFPLGLFKILREMKKSKKLMLMLGGVKKEFRGQGIDVLMAVRMWESARKKKMTLIDSHLILENNTRMRAECERLEGKVIKKFRIYQKKLI